MHKVCRKAPAKVMIMNASGKRRHLNYLLISAFSVSVGWKDEVAECRYMPDSPFPHYGHAINREMHIWRYFTAKCRERIFVARK